MIIELTRASLLVYLANHYTTRGAHEPNNNGLLINQVLVTQVSTNQALSNQAWTLKDLQEICYFSSCQLHSGTSVQQTCYPTHPKNIQENCDSDIFVTKELFYFILFIYGLVWLGFMAYQPLYVI